MDNIFLAKGNHRDHERGVCVMEAVAWFAGEAHTDAPQCACPVIAAFARQLNDKLDDEQRQRLKPLIPVLALSRADSPTTLKRAFIAADYAVRVCAPIALEASGFKQEAAALRTLAPIVDRETAKTGRAAAAAAAATAAAADSAARHTAAAAVACYAADSAARHANAADAAYAADAADAAADAAYAAADAADAADAAYAADAAADAAYAAAAAAARATRSQRLADLGIECLEKMLGAK